MDRTLENFITALRRSGVRISVAETMDALRAVELSGYGDRRVLKDFLSASLAKSMPEKEIFDVCFSRFFSLDYITGEDFLFENESLPPTLQGEAPLTQIFMSGDVGGLAMALRAAGERADVRSIQSWTQKGLFMQRLFQELGLEGLNRDIRTLAEIGGQDAINQVKALESMRDNLMERVKNLVERQLELYAARRSYELSEGYIKNARLSALDERDLARVHKVIQRMVKHLKDRYSRRPRAARRGHLDFRKTFRKSISYGGLPFDTHWKSKKIDRPEIIVICDVSRSVSNIVRFFLLILYSLNEVISRIRSFIFCTNLVDVSPLFEMHPLPEALAMLRSGAGIPILLGRTDYGGSLLDFKDQYSDCLTKKATVIILGDARNNYAEPHTEVLRMISERCKRLIWLNPETPSLWGSGDSEMKKYLPYCSIARECSTLRHLERVVEYLLRVHNR
ncbi:MAG: vWA domain-containing protein [Syntrophales bacterium]